MVWTHFFAQDQVVRYLFKEGNSEQSQFNSEFFLFLKASSEENLFYSEFSFF